MVGFKRGGEGSKVLGRAGNETRKEGLYQSKQTKGTIRYHQDKRKGKAANLCKQHPRHSAKLGPRKSVIITFGVRKRGGALHDPQNGGKTVREKKRQAKLLKRSIAYKTGQTSADAR